jgi:soluble cytochrome b562
MKSHQRHLSFCAFFLFLVLCPGLHADSPLETKMNQMRISFRELKKAMAAPVEADKQKYLSWVADLKSASEASKAMEPEKTSKVPADQKTAFLEGYRNKMDELADEIDSLGKAIEAGKWVEAKVLVAQINQVQREGHQKYRAESNEH